VVSITYQKFSSIRETGQLWESIASFFVFGANFFNKKGTPLWFVI